MCFGDWSREDLVSNEELYSFLFSDGDQDDDDESFNWFDNDD